MFAPMFLSIVTTVVLAAAATARPEASAFTLARRDPSWGDVVDTVRYFRYRADLYSHPAASKAVVTGLSI